MSELETEKEAVSHSIRWQDILDEWRASEEKQWEPVFRERGFSSWWEWRRSYLEDLDVENREWNEAWVEQPHVVIPRLVIGGYRGWKQYRPEGKDLATFTDVVGPVVSGEMSYAGTSRVDIRTNAKVIGLVGNLQNTTILVLRCPSLSVVLDATHRCAAIAVEAVDLTRGSSFVARVRFCEFKESERSQLEAFASDRQSLRKL